MLRIKALGPCTIGGFRTLLRGEVCDVPDERRDQVERLRNVGRVELLAVHTVAVEPSGNDTPTSEEAASSPAPTALDDDEAELARLQAELAELEAGGASDAPAAPEGPKRPLFVCVCGKTAPEHAKGKTRLDDSFCGGLKKFMQRAP